MAPTVRMLGLAAVCLVVAPGCSSNGQGVICYSPSDIRLRFPGGAPTIGTVTASGGCSIDDPLACVPEDAACDAAACACNVTIHLAQTAAADCRLHVTSATGATFDDDVPLTLSVDPCGAPDGVVPADANQWWITADFSTDGGARDAATD